MEDGPQYPQWSLPSNAIWINQVFQSLVNDVLRDMLNDFVFVYLNDITISPDVQKVLQRLLDNGLFIKAEKCDFHVTFVSFLGFVVSQDHLQTDPSKGSADLAHWFSNFYKHFI